MLSTAQIERIKLCFADLSADPLAVGTDIYQHIFANVPTMRARFPEDISPQALKLWRTLDMIVNSLDDLPALRRRAATGSDRALKSELYGVVGMSLLQAVSARAPRWNMQDKTAWMALYQLVADIITGTIASDIPLERRGSVQTARAS